MNICNSGSIPTASIATPKMAALSWGALPARSLPHPPCAVFRLRGETREVMAEPPEAAEGFRWRTQQGGSRWGERGWRRQRATMNNKFDAWVSPPAPLDRPPVPGLHGPEPAGASRCCPGAGRARRDESRGYAQHRPCSRGPAWPRGDAGPRGVGGGLVAVPHRGVAGRLVAPLVSRLFRPFAGNRAGGETCGVLGAGAVSARPRRCVCSAGGCGERGG